MFVIRLLVLLFFAGYGWGMGQSPSHELNDFGKFISASFFFTAPALYLLPTYEAWNNKQPNLTSIALVNVFLGWSLIGWVVALVWAFKKPEIVTATNRPGNANSSGVTEIIKQCPFCAEEVLVAAIKCKHCGSDLAKESI